MKTKSPLDVVWVALTVVVIGLLAIAPWAFGEPIGVYPPLCTKGSIANVLGACKPAYETYGWNK